MSASIFSLFHRRIDDPIAQRSNENMGITTKLWGDEGFGGLRNAKRAFTASY